MNLKEFFLDTLFPPYCLMCKTPLAHTTSLTVLCAPCLNTISVNETLFCVRCRARLADGTRVCHSDTPLRLASVGRYHDARLRLLITSLKYRRQTAALEALTVLTHRYLHNIHYDFTGYIIVPVPLHPTRQRRRGFNQSSLIAAIVAKHLGLPILESELRKVKPTLPQAATKNRDERIRNLEGCFVVAHPEAMQGKKILLVDDVCTSGTTLVEAASTLKQSGARQIIGFVMAKTD